MRRQSGLTLIELILSIVVLSIGVVGLFGVIRLTTAHSADPQVRKQALSIAEGMLEEIELARFTYCDPSDPIASLNTTTSPSQCSIPEDVKPETGNTRPYDNVNDYVTAYGSSQTYTTLVDGTSPAGYNVQVTITPEALNDINSAAAPAQTEVLRISVTVGYTGGSVTLDGYRTRYDPNAVP